MERYPHLFTEDRVWLPGRNFPGTPRIARLVARTHVLIRLKGDMPLERISPVLGDGSYIAEISGGGVTVTVRVIEYYAGAGGQGRAGDVLPDHRPDGRAGVPGPGTGGAV